MLYTTLLLKALGRELGLNGETLQLRETVMSEQNEAGADGAGS